MTTPYENDTDMAYEAEIPDSQEEPESCSSLSVCSGAEENPGGTQKSRQEPLDSAESGAPDDSSSFHTEDTVIIRGGTCLQKRRYVGFHPCLLYSAKSRLDTPTPVHVFILPFILSTLPIMVLNVGLNLL